MTIAISDVGTLLCVKGTDNLYSKLISVTSVPDTGAAPGTIDVTELDSPVKQYISDRPDTPAYEFESNYTKENYEAILAKISLTAPKDYLIFYQDGSGEKFTATGAAWKKGVTAGNAVKIGISFAVQNHEHVPDATILIETTPQNMSNGFGGATSESDKLGDSIGKASAKVKEFKKLIMSFDELHILTDTKQPSGGSGNGAGANSSFAVPDLTGYDNLMDSVTSKTDEIYKNIMTFFESIGKLLEPTIAAFSRLQVELSKLGQFAWQGLVDFYNSFLVPVGN